MCISLIYEMYRKGLRYYAGGNSQPLVSKEKLFKMSHAKTGQSFNKRKNL